MDGLRALAVAAVIAFHYTLNTRFANPVARLGWMGVDLFFVLSGFLITGILLRAKAGPAYFRTFYLRRTLRIFPVYFLLLATYAIAARVGGGPQPWSYWAMHAAFLSSTAEYFHFWSFAAPTFVYGGVTVLWTLSIEEQFYLLWAPIVRFMRERMLARFLAVIIVAAPVLRFWIHTAAAREYRFFPARLDSLAWGAALALGMAHCAADPDRLLRACRWLAAAAVVALAALLAITGGRRESLWFATFGYSAAAAAFAALVGWTVMRSRSDAWACRLLRLRPARYIGKVSYTLYLVHYPIVMLLASRIGHWGSLSASLLVAAASWQWLEAPLLRYKDRVMPVAAGGVEFSEPPGRGLRTVEVMARGD